MDNFIGVEGANLKAYTVHYSKNSIGTFKKDKAEFLLNKRELELVNAITGYNKFHKKHYLGVSDSNFLNKLKKNVKDIYLKKENSENEIFINDSFETCIKQKRVFYKTIWTPVDGVHKQPNCWDHKFNLLNKDFLKEWKPSPCTLDFFIFENQKCKNNFSKWWYSCNEKIGNNKKQRIGLTNKILDCILKVFAGGASISAYYAYLPNLDWTRPWTDEEIIQELKDKAGLPQDWKLD